MKINLELNVDWKRDTQCLILFFSFHEYFAFFSLLHQYFLLMIFSILSFFFFNFCCLTCFVFHLYLYLTSKIESNYRCSYLLMSMKGVYIYVSEWGWITGCLVGVFFFSYSLFIILIELYVIVFVVLLCWINIQYFIESMIHFFK